MWKILRLHMKNFIRIYSGLNKREIELDFTHSNKKVNVFVGKMGSGKTTILGHLQPFADYGTLDVHNREEAILEGEDGLKEIDFLHDGHIYSIKHVYTWNKSTETHNTKSFIQLDGQELNENGNVTSFREQIRIHFGIDQSFLRILRLGPNVANVINMKSTERKAFIATLLKETEIYALLYKKLSEDLRNLNSALTVLSNKLISLSSDQQSAFEAEAEDLEDQLQDLTKQIEKLKKSMAMLMGINSSLTNGAKLDLNEELKKSEDLLNLKQERMEDIQKLLDQLPKDGVQELSIRFGELSAQITNLEEELLTLQTKNEINRTSQNKIQDFLLLQEHQSQLDELEKKAQTIANDYHKAERQLQDFSTSYSYTQLNALIGTIESFQLSLDEMCSNNRELIQKVYHSDHTIQGWARKNLDISTARQRNYQKLLTNIQFSAEYSPPIPLFRPPMCPTDSCPFIQSHPAMIKAQNQTLTQIKEIQDEIASLDTQIHMYEECLIQWPKMQFLKKNWISISSILDNVGVLQERNLLRLLTNLEARTSWYDHEGLLAYIEKVAIYEHFHELKTRYLQVQSEIATLKSSNMEAKKAELETLKTEYETNISRMKEVQRAKAQITEEKEKLAQILATLTNREELQLERSQLEAEVKNIKAEQMALESKIHEFEDNRREIRLLDTQIATMNLEYNQKSQRYNLVQSTLRDIKSTTESYEEYRTQARELKLILSAVSSKEGIPLVMVKGFLDECKEIINDLIADIFEDSLEIVNFDISEDSNEFKIPYRINGQYVPDIELASQGQQAVISIALSFALTRKSMFDYNIPLLDEVDNSIHKSDRERFIMILTKQMRDLGTEQVFMITHNDIFQQSGLPVNIIMTTPEVVDTYPNQTIMQV